MVFGILGLFSLSYRQLAKEAFGCVFRRLVLRKCQSRLDQRARSQITGKLMKFSKPAAKFTYKYFRIIEFIFIILLVWSIVQTGVSGYNFYLYGNCNGPNEDGFCIFDPTGSNEQISQLNTLTCSDESVDKDLSIENINLSLFPVLNAGLKGEENVVVFIGCYECQYTKDTYPIIKELIEKENPLVIFAHLPINHALEDFTEYGNCIYEKEGPEKLLEFSDYMFSNQVDTCTIDTCSEAITKISLNFEEYAECVNSTKSLELNKLQSEELNKIGVYGTPTIFINGELFVGPKPYRVYKRALK